MVFDLLDQFFLLLISAFKSLELPEQTVYPALKCLSTNNWHFITEIPNDCLKEFKTVIKACGLQETVIDLVRASGRSMFKDGRLGDHLQEFLRTFIRDTTTSDHDDLECYVTEFGNMYRLITSPNSVVEIETELFDLMEAIRQGTTDTTKRPKYY